MFACACFGWNVVGRGFPFTQRARKALPGTRGTRAPEMSRAKKPKRWRRLVWEGRCREASPYPDHRRIRAFSEDAAWPIDGDPALGRTGAGYSGSLHETAIDGQ